MAATDGSQKVLVSAVLDFVGYWRSLQLGREVEIVSSGVCDQEWREVPAALPPESRGTKFPIPLDSGLFHLDFGLVLSLFGSKAWTAPSKAAGGVPSTCDNCTSRAIHRASAYPYSFEENKSGAYFCNKGKHAFCIGCLFKLSAGDPLRNDEGNPVQPGSIFHFEFDQTGLRYCHQRRDIPRCWLCDEKSKRVVAKCMGQKRVRDIRKAEGVPEPKRLRKKPQAVDSDPLIPTCKIAPGCWLVPEDKELSFGKGGTPLHVPALVYVHPNANLACGNKPCTTNCKHIKTLRKEPSLSYDDCFGSNCKGLEVLRVFERKTYGCLYLDGKRLRKEVPEFADTHTGPIVELFVVRDPEAREVVCVWSPGEGKQREWWCGVKRCQIRSRDKYELCEHFHKVTECYGDLKPTAGVPRPVFPALEWYPNWHDEQYANAGAGGAARVLTMHDRVVALRGEHPKIRVCNDVACRSAPSDELCSDPSHEGVFWECAGPGARGVFRADTWQRVETRRAERERNLCPDEDSGDNWSVKDYLARSEAGFFSAPREKVNSGRKCSEPLYRVESDAVIYRLEGQKNIPVKTYRRVCSNGCCTLAFSGVENNFFSYTLQTIYTQSALTRTNLANLLGSSFRASYLSGLHAHSLLSTLGTPQIRPQGKSAFDRVQRAFGVSTARSLGYKCDNDICRPMFNGEAPPAALDGVQATGHDIQALEEYAVRSKRTIVADGTFLAKSCVAVPTDVVGVVHPSVRAPSFSGHTTKRTAQWPQNKPRPKVPKDTIRTCRSIDDAERALVRRWTNVRRHDLPKKKSTKNKPLNETEYGKVREAIGEGGRKLVDRILKCKTCGEGCGVCRAVVKRDWMSEYAGNPSEVPATGWIPKHMYYYGVIINSLFGTDASWSHLVRVNGLKLARKALLGGVITTEELFFFEIDAPELAAVLKSYSPSSGKEGYRFEDEFLPLLLDIYCTALVSFEPSANKVAPSANKGDPSPLGRFRKAVGALREVDEKKRNGKVESPQEMKSRREEVAECNRILADLEIARPQQLNTMEASAAYKRQVSLVAHYPHLKGPLFERPSFPDMEGRGIGGPTVDRAKRLAGFFLLTCPDGYILGFHYISGAESINDLFTILVTHFTFEQLRGLTIVYDMAPQLYEYILDRVPALAKFVLCVTDRFHGGPEPNPKHVLIPSGFQISRFDEVHKMTKTSTAEMLNALLKKMRNSLREIVDFDYLMLRIATCLDLVSELRMLAKKFPAVLSEFLAEIGEEDKKDLELLLSL